MRHCFNQLVPAPKQRTMTKGEVFQLIVDLRASELRKAGCGQRVIHLYDDWRDHVRAENNR